MKQLLLAGLMALAQVSYAQTEASYYYSLKEKVPVDLNYQIVSIPYDDGQDVNSLTTKLALKGNQIKTIKRVHNKINRLDFSDALIPSALPAGMRSQVIPSMNIGKHPTPIFLTGEITVMPNERTDIDAIIKRYELTLVRKLEYGPFLLRVSDPSHTLEIANRIHETETVDWSSPDLLAKAVKFNDPLYPQQYYLKNTGQLGGTAGIDIKAEEAWAITKGCYVRVAVLDEGVNAHEEWNNGRLLGGHTAGSLNTGGAPSFDFDGHGVSCTGIIAASHDNALGIRGVAPNAYIIPVNILSNPLDADAGFTGVEIASAITWAVSPSGGNADVLSNSWGYDIPNFTDGNIQVAYNNARTTGRGNKGAILVFASGNHGNNWNGVAFPASQLNNIAVGAIQNTGAIWGYSGKGSPMDLVAPSGSPDDGGNVMTTDRMSTAGYVPGNYFANFGGTSAACPQVAGVAALMLSVNPTLTEVQVRTKLQQTAVDMGPGGFDNSFGYGRLNALAAVQSSLPTSFISGPSVVCPSASYSVTNMPAGATVTWSSSNTSILTINASTGAATRVGNGQVMITANIQYTAGCTAFRVTKTVNVGKPIISFTVNGQPFTNGQVCVGSSNYIDIVGHDPMNSYTWSLQSGSNGSLSGSGPSATFSNYTIQCSGISVVASNSCGTTNTGLTICTKNCLMAAYNVYPNPAKDYLNITFEDAKTLAALPEQIILYSEKSTAPVRSVLVKDTYNQGAFKNGNTIELQVKDLPRGNYYLHVVPGKDSEQKADKIRILLE